MMQEVVAQSRRDASGQRGFHTVQTRTIVRFRRLRNDDVCRCRRPVLRRRKRSAGLSR